MVPLLGVAVSVVVDERVGVSVAIVDERVGVGVVVFAPGVSVRAGGMLVGFEPIALVVGVADGSVLMRAVLVGPLTIARGVTVGVSNTRTLIGVTVGAFGTSGTIGSSAVGKAAAIARVAVGVVANAVAVSRSEAIARGSSSGTAAMSSKNFQGE